MHSDLGASLLICALPRHLSVGKCKAYLQALFSASCHARILCRDLFIRSPGSRIIVDKPRFLNFD